VLVGLLSLAAAGIWFVNSDDPMDPVYILPEFVPFKAPAALVAYVFMGLCLLPAICLELANTRSGIASLRNDNSVIVYLTIALGLVATVGVYARWLRPLKRG
jgi:hypothetical protein